MLLNLDLWIRMMARGRGCVNILCFKNGGGVPCIRATGG